MANCIQVSATRTFCALHHQLVQRNCKLFKALGCKPYVLLPPKNISITSRSNVHCANPKVLDNNEDSNIPFVPTLSMRNTGHFNKFEYLPKSDEKSNSYIAFQKSNIAFVDKKDVSKIQDLIQSNKPDQGQSNSFNKASPEQVETIAKVLKQDLPNLFSKHQNYKIFHPLLEFENHLTGTHTRTLQDYVKQLALLKITGHIKFAYIEFQILKMTTHHSEGTIKVRWRIRGLTGIKVIMSFWKYKVWNLKDTAFKDCKSWYEGFSIFYVKGDGVVHKHLLLKMQPDEDFEVETIKPVITAKVA